MPRVYFGFDAQSVPGEHIFLSYSRTDEARIKGIALELHKIGLPIWYDDGLIPGNLWKKEIRRQVKESRVTVFFLTKELFQRDGTFMIDEYQFAKDHGKPKICIFLDDIANMDCAALADEMYFWWLELKKLQSIEVINLPSDKEKADEIFHGLCRADRKFTQYASTTESKPHTNATPKSIRQPQPPSPTFQPPVPKAEQKPASVTQPVNQPNPATYTAPIPQQSAAATKPAPAPIFRESAPKQEQMKPVSKKTVKHTPLIVTVAVVLVFAMVSGIWAISNFNSSQIDNSDLAGLDAVYNGKYYTFTFGNYPQGEDGEEQPIEWRVLAVEDGKALVISEKLLDCVKYNKTYTDVTWETCTLRNWMNNDFISKAFSSSQQAKISTVTIQNPDNPSYGTKGGNATQDKIFALSIDEAEKYFGSGEDRMAAPTEYAIKNGAWTSDHYSLPTGEKTGWWWLRSPGYYRGDAAYVDNYGIIAQVGDSVSLNYGCVRPAFWLNL